MPTTENENEYKRPLKTKYASCKYLPSSLWKTLNNFILKHTFKIRMADKKIAKFTLSVQIVWKVIFEGVNK